MHACAGYRNAAIEQPLAPTAALAGRAATEVAALHLRPHSVCMLQAAADVSPYAQFPGFNMHACFPDILHVFHLGVGQDLGASCICMLLQMELLPGKNHNDALTLLGMEIRAWCTVKGIVTPARCPGRVIVCSEHVSLRKALRPWLGEHTTCWGAGSSSRLIALRGAGASASRCSGRSDCVTRRTLSSRAT